MGLMTNDWGSYLSDITGGATGADIARKLGVSEGKVSYWRRGERPPTIADCIAVSKAYGRPPLEGLVKAGYLEPDDASEQIVVQNHSLRQFSDAELAEELLRRTTGR